MAWRIIFERTVFMAFTFRGGIHVDEHKDTASSQIKTMPTPAKVAIPLSQHIGAPVLPLVKKGDSVKMGQVIGRNDDALSCPVHASVSGTVVDIEQRNSYTSGGKTTYIVIESDGKDELDESIAPFGKPLEEATLEDIVNVVRNAGISGMGGATFPTYAKISSAAGKVTDLIVNCAECEPYITANHRLMLEDAESVVYGAKILMHALGLGKVTLAIEDNKKDAIKLLRDFTSEDDSVEIAVLKTKYPQGDERQIIYALKKTELPAGKLPADVGCVLFNTETCAAVRHAFYEGMPLIRRIVTVAGDCIKEPANLSVPLGTSFDDVIAFCGGFSKQPERLVNGGPMMGFAQWDMNAVVTKGTSALLALSPEKIKKTEPNCIHCGRCISACPMHLMPNYLAAFSAKGDYDTCESFNAMSCVECGCCTYTCPGNVPIVQHIRVAKGKIREKKNKLKK